MVRQKCSGIRRSYLAECHMSLALHGKSELELAAQKALELLDYVSDITTVDGKILAIMGLITGLSGQAKVSHILFEQAKIHSTDIASLYYYRALVHFHNEKIEEARICIVILTLHLRTAFVS